MLAHTRTHARVADVETGSPGKGTPSVLPPLPPQALPQRLLLHGWHNFCFNVHIEVKFQSETLLAWVLRVEVSVSIPTGTPLFT